MSAATRAMPLRRHQLAWLADAGWQKILERGWDDAARDCLSHWAARRLPLVVTRQAPVAHGSDAIALGLPAPARWSRRRIGVEVARGDVLYFDEFPRAHDVEGLLPASARAGWRRLCAGLAACGAAARVYGSYGWERLSDLHYVRAASDIDVWVRVSDGDQADAVAAQLAHFDGAAPRLDGELVFDDGTAVAWREWLAWRSGRASELLVKRIDGSALVRTLAGCRAASPADAVS